MTSKIYSSEGFVLTRKNYSEADRIIRIYSKDFGKLTLLAKGVRKLKSRKRGNIEVFSRIKFSATHTSAFDLLTETLPVDLYNDIRPSLKKTSLAYYFMEVIDKITQEGEKHMSLYEYLTEYMENLGRDSKLKLLRKDFVYKVLVSLGYWPAGKKMENADEVLTDILERKVNSVRVGKAVLS